MAGSESFAARGTACGERTLGGIDDAIDSRARVWRPRSRPAQPRCFARSRAEAQTGTPAPAGSPSAQTAVTPPPLVNDLAWAYAITPGPAAPAPADDGTKLTLPGAEKTFTLDQIRNRMGPADWFPGDHPSMPSVVAIGREQAGIWACSLCHYPNGKGRPENAGIAGLNRDYFIQQLHDFKSGARQSADARKPNTPIMAGFGGADDRGRDPPVGGLLQLDSSGRRGSKSSSPTRCRRRVRRAACGCRLEGADAGTEPLGRRIIETPKNTEYTEKLRNPRSGFTAYVPKGSIAKGEALATKPSSEDDAVHDLPRRRSRRSRGRADAARSLAELHRAAACRLEARHSARALVAADGAGGREPHGRRHPESLGVSLVAAASLSRGLSRVGNR